MAKDIPTYNWRPDVWGLGTDYDKNGNAVSWGWIWTAEAYNTWNIDTTNQDTYAWATNQNNTNIPNTDTTNNISNPYDLNRGELQNKIWDINSQYTNAISSFNKWDIVDKMRLKTGWVADLDSAIENLKVDFNKSRPELMKRYANVIDPRKREALISAEESNIAKNINDLSAVRKYRLGTIQEMTNAEISTQENKLKWLEAQYNLYNNVLWDMSKADKAKSDMEKTALDIQKKQVELKWLEDKYWLEFQQGSTSIWKWTTQNRPDRNNNPGNVKLAIWQDVNSIPGSVWQDDQWHLIFDTPQAGYNWMVKDLSSKLSGNTSTWLTPNSTLADLWKVYAEDPNWINNVSSISKISPNTLLKDINVNQLAPAVARAEWFTGIDKIETGYVKTWLTAEEKKAEEKKKELEKYNLTNTKDFNKLQKTSSNNIITKMTPENVDKVLQDDIWKWELSSNDTNKLLDKSSDAVYNDYIKKELVHNLTNESDVDTVVATVKDSLKQYSESEMIDILKEAGIFNKKWLKKGFFNDDAWYDKLQELLPSL